MSKGLTLDQVRELPALINIDTAARVLGIENATAYIYIREGRFPVPVVKLGQRKRVRTADLVRFLGGNDAPARAIDPRKRYRVKSTGETVLGSELIRRRQAS